MSKHDLWDLILKGMAAIGLLVGGAVGFWKYLDASSRELRRPFWERQLALYLDATSAAATLATTDDADKWKEALDKFWQLYFGPLAVVQDKIVERAMIDFATALRDCERPGDNHNNLKNAALRLAHGCRDSVSESWNVELTKLPRAWI